VYQGIRDVPDHRHALGGGSETEQGLASRRLRREGTRMNACLRIVSTWSFGQSTVAREAMMDEPNASTDVPEDLETLAAEPIVLPRWLRRAGEVLLGAALGLFTLLPTWGSALMVIEHRAADSLWKLILSLVLLGGCLWVLAKCLRLVFGRRIGGALMTPLALRLFAWLLLCFAVGGIFTDYYTEMGLLAILQGITCLWFFFHLHRLARDRKR
jgi:hypothetical protein